MECADDEVVKILANVPEFVKKLFNLKIYPEVDAYADFIHWSPSGKTFIVRDQAKFSKFVLPRHYKHKNFQTFIRQLNKYDFHKSHDNTLEVMNYLAFVEPTYKDSKDLKEDILEKISKNLNNSSSNLSRLSSLSESFDQNLQNLFKFDPSQNNLAASSSFPPNNGTATFQDFQFELPNQAVFDSANNAQINESKPLLDPSTSKASITSTHNPLQTNLKPPQDFNPALKLSDSKTPFSTPIDYILTDPNLGNSLDTTATIHDSLSKLHPNYASLNLGFQLNNDPKLGVSTQAVNSLSTQDLFNSASFVISTSENPNISSSTPFNRKAIDLLYQGIDRQSARNRQLERIINASKKHRINSDESNFAIVFKKGKHPLGQKQTSESNSNVFSGNTWIQPPKVLLVEDREVDRDVASRILKVFGCSIDLASDGNVAVSKMNDKHYDIVLMDILMPNLDGVSATTYIRSFDRITPIISLTSTADTKSCTLYVKKGMNEVLEKPLTKDRVLRLLNKYCSHLNLQKSDNLQIAPVLQNFVIDPSFQYIDSNKITEINDNSADSPDDNKGVQSDVPTSAMPVPAQSVSFDKNYSNQAVQNNEPIQTPKFDYNNPEKVSSPNKNNPRFSHHFNHELGIDSSNISLEASNFKTHILNSTNPNLAFSDQIEQKTGESSLQQPPMDYPSKHNQKFNTSHFHP
ncbi:hypothetical protein BB560_006515, partial [Smittium megazygosporum]